MYFIEPGQYAPDYLKKLVAAHNAENGEARAKLEIVSIARRYDSDPEKHPVLRDRKPEIERLLKGYVGPDAVVHSVSYTGAELRKKFDWDPVGAQFAHTYDVLWVNAPAVRKEKAA